MPLTLLAFLACFGAFSLYMLLMLAVWYSPSTCSVKGLWKRRAYLLLHAVLFPIVFPGALLWAYGYDKKYREKDGLKKLFKGAREAFADIYLESIPEQWQKSFVAY